MFILFSASTDDDDDDGDLRRACLQITAAQQISKLIPQMMQPPPQQRSRFDHPQQGMSGPGGSMGPGGPRMDNPRMGGQSGGRDDFFDSKRMRRF